MPRSSGPASQCPPERRSGDADVVRRARHGVAVGGVEQVELRRVEPELRAVAGLPGAAPVDAGARVAARAARHVARAGVLLELAQLLGLELLGLLEVEVGVDL